MNKNIPPSTEIESDPPDFVEEQHALIQTNMSNEVATPPQNHTFAGVDDLFKEFPEDLIDNNELDFSDKSQLDHYLQSNEGGGVEANRNAESHDNVLMQQQYSEITDWLHDISNQSDPVPFPIQFVNSLTYTLPPPTPDSGQAPNPLSSRNAVNMQKDQDQAVDGCESREFVLIKQ